MTAFFCRLTIGMVGFLIGCAQTTEQPLTLDEAGARIKQQELLRAGNTYCRFLAARLALAESDYEFGGYDPAGDPVNWNKAMAWAGECRPAFREIWEWRHYHMTSQLPRTEDERLMDEAIRRQIERYREELDAQRVREAEILRETSLYEKYR